MYSVGIDLGGTNIAAGIVDLDNYKIVGKASVPTDLPRSAEEIAVSIKQATLMAAVEASVLMDDVVSVGIDSIEGDNAAENTAVYSIDGQLVNKSGKVNALKKGLYIVNGKKVFIK